MDRWGTTDRTGAGHRGLTPAQPALHFVNTAPAAARSARCARYERLLVFRTIAPSTTRSKNAIASGGSPRYSPHDSFGRWGQDAGVRTLGS